MPADHELDPAARVKLGEYRGDEILFACRPGHRQVDRPGHLRQRQARPGAGVPEAGGGGAGQPDRGQPLAPGVADQPPRAGPVDHFQQVSPHPRLGRGRQVAGRQPGRGHGLGHLAQQRALRDPRHRPGLAEPPLRSAAQYRVGHREPGQQRQHGQPGDRVPGRPAPLRVSPSPSRVVQPASSPVSRGGSTREASSGAIASQASVVSGPPMAYCAAAAAVTATASTSPAARLPGTPPCTGPAGSSGIPPAAGSDRHQDQRGTRQPSPRADLPPSGTAAGADRRRAEADPAHGPSAALLPGPARPGRCTPTRVGPRRGPRPDMDARPAPQPPHQAPPRKPADARTGNPGQETRCILKTITGPQSRLTVADR